jgi:hypothetical protein
MIEPGPAKITLASLAGGREELSPAVLVASRELRAAVDVVLRRAQDAGQARREATVDEVYLLVRSLAHAATAMPVPPDTLRRAAGIILAGLAGPVTTNGGEGATGPVRHAVRVPERSGPERHRAAPRRREAR